jgi:hypothetical protein
MKNYKYFECWQPTVFRLQVAGAGAILRRDYRKHHSHTYMLVVSEIYISDRGQVENKGEN